MTKRRTEEEVTGKGTVILKSVMEAMRAEKALRRAGYPTRMVAPPPDIRSGCDLAIEFDLIERIGLERTLREHRIHPLDIVVSDHVGLRPIELTKEIDFGQHVMVKAGNVKLTFEKETGRIVNVSGGGCPDIPYLTVNLLGKRLMDAPRPRDVGYTLCAYMLDKAFERAMTLITGGQ